MDELQEKLDASILDYDYKTAGEITVKMMIKEETEKLHKLYRDEVIKSAETDQLIRELSQENQGLQKIIRRMEVQNENKR